VTECCACAVGVAAVSPTRARAGAVSSAGNRPGRTRRVAPEPGAVRWCFPHAAAVVRFAYLAPIGLFTTVAALAATVFALTGTAGRLPAVTSISIVPYAFAEVSGLMATSTVLGFAARLNFQESRRVGSRYVSRRILVLATTSVPQAELRERVRAHAGEDAELLVVVPASNISKLDWLTNAEDDARADAAQLAEEVADRASGGDVETRVGDSDPVKAVEDALSDFPADELIVITRAREEADWLDERSGAAAPNRFSLPVTRIVVAE
jgi:hypothetical protein